MSDTNESQKRRIAAFMGVLSGLHAQAKALESEGVEEMDMVACQVEDMFSTLEPLLGESGQSESLARNG